MNVFGAHDTPTNNAAGESVSHTTLNCSLTASIGVHKMVFTTSGRGYTFVQVDAEARIKGAGLAARPPVCDARS